MKLITCIGYTFSGSSAVNNLLREFDNCCELTPNNECRFLQDPDGIADLEYNLFDNRHRLNSEYAIKRYSKYTNKIDKRNFEQIFGESWTILNKEYINSLFKFSYKSYWHADLRDLNIFQKIKYYSIRASRIILNKINPNIKRECNKNYFKSFKMYLPICSRNEFLNNTRVFCSKLFEGLNVNNNEFGIVDQLIPPRNVDRYLRYVDNLKVVIVDRDPRDIFMETALSKDRAFPYDDVEKFCEIYKDNRAGKVQNENVLEIHFEDLIYNYEKTYNTIVNFIGINDKNHTKKGRYFSIPKSKEHTRLWEKNHKYDSEIDYIEKNLKEYLYKY